MLPAAEVKEGLQPHFVEQYSQVFDLAFNYDEAEVVQELQAKDGVPAWAENLPASPS